MTDIISRERRRWNMSRIKRRDTGPERALRSRLHQMGFRFRLDRKDLPGSPDIVLHRYRVAVFVHGCFWHRHSGCQLAYTPKSNRAFWQAKFQGTKQRDRRSVRALRRLGWRAFVVWECDIANNAQHVTEVLVKSMKSIQHL